VRTNLAGPELDIDLKQLARWVPQDNTTEALAEYSITVGLAICPQAEPLSFGVSTLLRKVGGAARLGVA
jgi:hypothetical protein